MTDLVEFIGVSQDPYEPKRRWFSAPGTDLIVWLGEDDLPFGFQLCYERGTTEFALTWTTERGFDHSAVDPGEDNPLKNRTPILVPDGQFEPSELLKTFQASSSKVPEPIRKLIIDALTQYPNDPVAPGKRPRLKVRVPKYRLAPLTWEQIFWSGIFLVVALYVLLKALLR